MTRTHLKFIVVVLICSLFSSCKQDIVVLPNLILFSNGSGGREFCYDIREGGVLHASITSGVIFDLNKHKYSISTKYDEKIINLSTKDRKKLLLFFKALQNKQPEKYITCVEDAPVITVLLSGREYVSMLADSTYEAKYPEAVDSDVLRLMEQLMKIAPFPNDERWGSFYHWINQNIK